MVFSKNLEHFLILCGAQISESTYLPTCWISPCRWEMAGSVGAIRHSTCISPNHLVLLPTGAGLLDGTGLHRVVSASAAVPRTPGKGTAVRCHAGMARGGQCLAMPLGPEALVVASRLLSLPAPPLLGGSQTMPLRCSCRPSTPRAKLGCFASRVKGWRFCVRRAKAKDPRPAHATHAKPRGGPGPTGGTWGSSESTRRGDIRTRRNAAAEARKLTARAGQGHR